MKRIISLLLIILFSISNGSTARANPGPGSIDAGFDPGGGAEHIISVAIQPDGKVIIAGNFTQYDSHPTNDIARLNSDGSFDTSFDPGNGIDGGYVMDVAIQPDGKIVIGGTFDRIDSTPRYSIARLNPDGSVDTSFDPGSGTDDRVDAVAIQPDGKILIGGWFTTIDGVARKSLARLNPDGSIDASFDPGDWNNDGVTSIALQPDGKILAGGGDDQLSEPDQGVIFRLNSDGSLDPSFNPGDIEGLAEMVYVKAVSLQPDGKVIIAGWFFKIDGVERERIARLNSDGSLDTSFDIGPNEGVTSILAQPDGRILLGGRGFSSNGTNIDGIVRLKADSSLDTSFDPGSGMDAGVDDIALQADGKVLAIGIFHTVDGIARNSIARLNIDGSLDIGFSSTNGADENVYDMVAQPDGKVLVGGAFSSVHDFPRSRISRLNANGTVDLSFDPGIISGDWVSTIALQPDGKILIGGAFTQINGVNRSNIARLNADGSLDESFDPGSGANDWVWGIVIQSDGKVVIGGLFSSVNGYSHSKIARLYPNGAVDASYNPGCEANYAVHALAIQPDDKVLVGGLFHFMNNVGREKIARLNTDGSLDTSFDPGSGTSGTVLDIGMQPDGKAIIAGEFTQVDGTIRERIARLNSDGSLDHSFASGCCGANGTIHSVDIQSDGRILVGGEFSQVDLAAKNNIARLNPDGSLDPSFDTGTGPNDDVSDITIQEDGKILIGGYFTSINGAPAGCIARLDGSTSPLFTSPAPGPAVIGTPYSHIFTVTGYPFTPAIRFLSGSLPPGLVLDTADGSLYGTPTQAGTYQFVLSASNWIAPNGQQEVTLIVEKLPTITRIISHEPNPSNVGESVTVEYAVTSASGIPTGEVIVSDGVASCRGSVADGGCNLTFTTFGTKTITAIYTGDPVFKESASTAVEQIVEKASTSTTIHSHEPNPSAPGEAVTVEYWVTSASGIPTGEVIVSDGEASCSGSAPSGSCSLTLTSSGTKTITAKYTGDQVFKESTSETVEHSVITVENPVDLKLSLPLHFNRT